MAAGDFYTWQIEILYQLAGELHYLILPNNIIIKVIITITFCYRLKD